MPIEASFLPYPPHRAIRDLYAWDRPTAGCYPPHYHTQAEILYIVEGRIQAEVDFTLHTAQTGDVVLLCPNQIHRFLEPWGPARTWTFVFESKLMPAFAELLGEKKPVVPVIGGISSVPEAPGLLRRILEECDSPKPYAAQIAAGALTLLLGVLLRRCPLRERGKMDETTASRILHFCYEHYQEPLSLAEAARALRLSPYYLSHLMPQKYGVSFTQLLTRIRLDDARRRLLMGSSVTVAALDAGFSSTRTFHRAFRARYGGSPSELLKFETKPLP